MKLKDLNWVRGLIIALVVYLTVLAASPVFASGCTKWAWVLVAGKWTRVCVAYG